MRIQGRTRLIRAVMIASVAIVLTACAPPNPAIADLEPVEFPDPVAVEPGAQLALGEAAWVEQASGGETTLLGVAVLDIIEGESWIWKNFENAEEVFDYTPFFVVVQRQWLSADEKWDITLYPLLSDGSPGFVMETDAMGAINPATCDDFDLGLPRLDDPFQRFDCMLAAAPNGTSVTGVFYDGTFARENGTLEPTAYLDAPVAWMAG